MALVYSDLTRTEVHFPGSFDNMPLLALVAGIRSWMHLVNATYGWNASLGFMASRYFCVVLASSLRDLDVQFHTLALIHSYSASI
jgi:3-hydroxymyristoyl/3-hydroxydecanoyl-(acyl carrier protein) dehydratase